MQDIKDKKPLNFSVAYVVEKIQDQPEDKPDYNYKGVIYYAEKNQPRLMLHFDIRRSGYGEMVKHCIKSALIHMGKRFHYLGNTHYECIKMINIL